MLYHAILQLNQKAKQTRRVSKQKNQSNSKHRQLLKQKQTKKQISQQAFNKKNTVDRRNELKLLANTTKPPTA